MSVQASSAEITLLQEMIRRRAERATRRLFLVVVTDVVAFLAAATWGLAPPAFALVPTAPTAAVPAAVVVMTLLYLAGGPCLCRRQVRRQLSHLPRSQQVQVLLSIREQISDDAADIVSPLLQQLRVKELLPSAPPGGMGSEASPIRR
jgi:hypothetical protein